MLLLTKRLSGWRSSTGPPLDLVNKRRQQRTDEGKVARMLVAVQRAVLELRPRAHNGGAAKARKRKQPAMPRPLRQGKRRRVETQPDEPPGPVRASAFLDKGVRARVSPQAANNLVHWLRPRPVPGMHTFLPDAGPTEEPGEWARAKSGIVRWGMSCDNCGVRAMDSSRWKQLIFRKCGQEAVPQWQSVQHDLVQCGRLWRCRSCGMQADKGHRQAAERAKCPVPMCLNDGIRDKAKEATARDWLGYFALWHTMAYGKPGMIHPPAGEAVPDPPDRPDREPAAAREHPQLRVPAMPLVPFGRAYHTHRPVQTGGVRFCVRCGGTPRDNRRWLVWAQERCDHEVPLARWGYRVRHVVGKIADGQLSVTGEGNNARLATILAEAEQRRPSEGHWQRLLGRACEDGPAAAFSRGEGAWGSASVLSSRGEGARGSASGS